jgi:ABC-type multidrug transport system ATPase subunit
MLGGVVDPDPDEEEMTDAAPLTSDVVPATPAPAADRAVSIRAVGLRTEHRGGITALDDVTLTIEPGRLTAVIGPSGAGKTTLLRALAGVAPAQEGTVSFLGAAPAGGPAGVGFVPQDDILHRELPLRRTLRYAAALRLAAPRSDIDAAVTEAMNTLGLARHGEVPVHSLSGGQRKRASIACEILTRPGVCFLDEPTSGLDPSAAVDLIAGLRRMCVEGSTVVFTTHRLEDIGQSDRVVVLAPGGRLVASGPPAEVLERLGAATFTELYERLAADATKPATGHALEPGPDLAGTAAVASARSSRRPAPAARPRAVQQWWVLTRRAADILVRNRLTLAILLGSPASVIAMFAVLFRPGGLDRPAGDPTAAVQVAYWLAFAGFFFGLTFGLLQICTEMSVLRRERHAGVRTGPYLLSKLALLTPILLVVNAAMILVLRALDRIPELPARALTQLYVTMAINAVAALCLGLLASAVVTSTTQAALALPMLCFPAVLFSGAIVPTPVMAGAGRAIAAVMSDRWAFESIAGRLGVAERAGAASPYAGLGASAQSVYWVLLLVFTVLWGGGAYAALRVRTVAGSADARR